MNLTREKHQKDIERFIRKMPSLSTTVGKVMEICSRTDASPNELNKVISLDPVLTGQVLKLVNSAYYSLVSKITSLTRAITMLGMNTVKNMALSTAIISTVSGTRKSLALPATRFWTHSISAGVSAKLLANMRSVPIVEQEELFVAGLLHDLGKIPFGDEYIEVLRHAKEHQLPLIEVERELMGIDHQQVGLMIAEKWKLNEVITTCISQHHNVHEVKGEVRTQVAYVALGNLYSNILEIGFAGNLYPPESDVAEYLDVVNLGIKDFSQIGSEVREEIRKAENFLGASARCVF
ncbi:MAG: HDOD domain-containing protein [Desulfopila sp.]